MERYWDWCNSLFTLITSFTATRRFATMLSQRERCSSRPPQHTGAWPRCQFETRNFLGFAAYIFYCTFTLFFPHIRWIFDCTLIISIRFYCTLLLLVGWILLFSFLLSDLTRLHKFFFWILLLFVFVIEFDEIL